MTTMNERMAALDEFASQTAMEGQVLMPAVTTHAPPPSLIHGAQAVVVARDEGKVLKRIRTLAQAAGDAWYYRIPFKDRKTGRTTFVEGPSVKLANDVARIYGSCDVDEWVSGEGLDYWEFTARFIDLESGFALTRVFRQRKDAASVGKNESRNAEIGFAIGASKAIRNVVVNALQTFTDFAYEEARSALVTQIGQDIERWRKQVSERIGAITDIKRVEAVIGRSVKDWLAPDIATVAAMGKAIKDGMASIDESFPPLQRQEHASTKDKLDEVSAGASQPAGKEAAGDGSSGGRSPDEHPPQPAASTKPADRNEATDKMLALAADASLDVEARQEMLENAAEMWEDRLEPDYLAALVKTCMQVAKGFMIKKDALKTLETFK
jgi:hypothetical protein